MKIKKLAFALPILLMISQCAFAGDLFSVPAGDISIKLLKAVFGSLFGGEGDGPLGAPIGKLNAACLLIGGLLLGYVLTFGTMKTAHDGKVLGKWDSAWVPIRTALGTALMVPVGSYCAGQMLVAWLITQSAGLAGEIWTGFVSSQFSAQATVPTVIHAPKVEAFAYGLTRSLVCLEAYKKIKADSPDVAVILGDPVISGDFATTREYGMSGQSSTACGGVSGAGAAGTSKVANKLLDWFGIGKGMAEKADAITQAHTQAAAKLEADLQPVAALTVNGNGVSGGARAKYEAAIAAYEKSVGEVAAAQLGGDSYFEEMQRNAEANGWVLSGSWFLKYLSLLDNTMKALQSGPTPIAVEKSDFPDLDRYFAALQGTIKSPLKKSGIDNQLTADKSRDDSQAGISGAILDKIASAFDFSSGGFFNWATEADSGKHPLLVAMHVGHMTINAGVAALAAAVGLSALPGIGTGLMIAAVMPLTTMIVFGATLAYVLPMLPFIYFIGGVLAWLIMCIEAIVGTPLWLLAHLKPGGDELHSGASSGYMLVLQVFLTPPLLVLGFCACLVLTKVAGQLLSDVFFSTFTMSQGGFVGIIGVLTAIGLYTQLQHMQLKYLFAKIPSLGQDVIRWLGGHAQSLLSEVGSAFANSEHKSGAAINALGASILAAGQAHQGIKQRQAEQKREREAAAKAATEKLDRSNSQQQKEEKKKPQAKAKTPEGGNGNGTPANANEQPGGMPNSGQTMQEKAGKAPEANPKGEESGNAPEVQQTPSDGAALMPEKLDKEAG